jgi:2-methylcitrate dehydratase
MDAPTRAMTEYAVSLKYGSIAPSSIKATILHLIDSVACALGALHSRPAMVSRRIANTAFSTFGASVIGLPHRTTPEYAAFANTVMVRYLDFNDTGIGGHPSDMIPAVLALAEPIHASGKEVIRAIHAEYEIVAALRRAGFTPRKQHVDQVQAVLGAAAGSGIILGLDLPQMANAISLAITANIPLRVTRTGKISDWKGCATAHCAMMAVLAARWAKEGLTAPPDPFEGIAGLYELLRVGPFNMEGVGLPRNGLGAIESTGLKFYPAEYSAQGPLGAVLELRKQFRLEEVEQVNISLPWGGWHEIGGGQGDREEKWNPTTRESADHSLPYLVAVALSDAEITPESFSDERIRDPALRPLMQKITVREDPELTREHAGELPRWPSVVEVVLRNGKRVTQPSCLPKGHPLNPLSDAELETKFWSMSDRALSRTQGKKLLNTLWSLESLQDINELTDQFRTIIAA